MMARTGRGRTALALYVAAGIAGGAAGRAEAAFTYTVLQQGADVVVTGSGFINLAGLEFQGPSPGQSAIVANQPYIGVGGSGFGEVYDGYSGPSDFGPGGPVYASASSGSAVILSAFGLLLPSGYESGAPLANTLTFANQTFATLGITPGTYVWTWGIDNAADSFTVLIGSDAIAPVPEPAAALLIGAGLLGVAATRRRTAA